LFIAIVNDRIQRFFKRFIQSIWFTLFGTFIVPPFLPVSFAAFLTLLTVALAAFLAFAVVFLAAALALEVVFLAEVFADFAAFLAFAGAFLAAALALEVVFLAEVFADFAAFLAFAGAFLAAALALEVVFLAVLVTLVAAFAAASTFPATAALNPAFCKADDVDFDNLATLSIFAATNFFADAALTLGSADNFSVFELVPLPAMRSPMLMENGAHTSIL
jgi:hypothetical protein